MKSHDHISIPPILRSGDRFAMTARAAFKQADVTRACKAAGAAGLKVSRILINDNGIEVVIGEPESTGKSRNNPLDRLHAA